MTKDVIVIGGGHNGLTAACYLARAGRKVILLEASPTHGGMTATNPVIAEAPHHRINEGGMDVTLLQSTHIVEDLELTRFGYETIEADPPYAFLQADGTSMVIWRDAKKTADEIRRFSPKDAAAYLDFANDMDAMMNAVIPYMSGHPIRVNIPALLVGVAKTMLKPSRYKGMLRFISASEGEYLEEKFESPLVRSMLEAICPFLPLYQQGTAWLLVQMGFLHRFGVRRVKTGTGGLTDALARAFVAHGGEIRTNARVETITIEGGRATGVRLVDGEELKASAVLAACNVKYTLTDLVPQEALTDLERSQAKHIPIVQDGASSFKIDLALDHQVDLSRFEKRRDDGIELRKCGLVWVDFEQHAAAWRDCAAGALPNPLPTFNLIPTANDPTQAPPGQETVWIWSGIAPATPTEPWATLKDRAATQTLELANQFLGGLLEHEIGRRVMSPDDLEQRFTVPHGNVYHVDIGSVRFGPFRPAPAFADFTTSIEGLFLSGGGMHPSSGICGVPGHVAAKTLLRKMR